MGANAITSLVKIVSGDTPTGDQFTFGLGGIPVFATTVTRDAAFGGANEKALAQGQLCYLESTNVVQYYNGSAWATLAPSVSSPITAIGIDQVLTQESHTSATYVALATASSVSIVTGTTAIVTVSGANINSLVTERNLMGFAISGATTVAASDDYATELLNVIASLGTAPSHVSATFKVTGLTPGTNVFTTQFRRSAGTSYWRNRTITVMAI